MSGEINPQKTSSLVRSNTIKSKIMQEAPTFAEKLREIKALITSLPQEKQLQVIAHLDELQDIYLADTHRDKLKFDKTEEGEEARVRGKKSEKVILEVRDGKKVQNELKIEGRLKSPEKKTEDKKFIKFEPKKVKTEITPGLGNILKGAP